MLNLFQHPITYVRYAKLPLANEMPKQVRYNLLFLDVQ